MKILFSALIILGVLAVPAYSGSISSSFMDEYESGKAVYIDKKTGNERSKFTFSMQRVLREGKIFYKISDEGKGDYDKYTGITWVSYADAEERSGMLYVDYSLRTVRDDAGEIIIKQEKKFDYSSKKIYYTAFNKEGNIIKKAIFPLREKTTDNICLVSFFRAFVAHRDDKKYRSFYLISSEPRRYKIDIKVIGEEVLRLPSGDVKAIKLRLIPDMGLLTGLSNALVPPTFVWYVDKAPYTWLQYEGLESGLGTSYIVTHIE